MGKVHGAVAIRRGHTVGVTGDQHARHIERPVQVGVVGQHIQIGERTAFGHRRAGEVIVVGHRGIVHRGHG